MSMWANDNKCCERVN